MNYLWHFDKFNDIRNNFNPINLKFNGGFSYQIATILNLFLTIRTVWKPFFLDGHSTEESGSSSLPFPEWCNEFIVAYEKGQTDPHERRRKFRWPI